MQRDPWGPGGFGSAESRLVSAGACWCLAAPLGQVRPPAPRPAGRHRSSSVRAWASGVWSPLKGLNHGPTVPVPGWLAGRSAPAVGARSTSAATRGSAAGA